MTRQQGLAVLLQFVISTLVFVVGSALSGSAFAFSNGAAAVGTTPVFALFFSSPDLGLAALALDDASYQLLACFHPHQGMPAARITWTGVFNPGADIDLTVTTDFEDVAAPVADVSEFTNQERALVTDTMSSTIFWNGVMGGLLGVSIHLILSSDLWRFLS